MAWSIGWLDLYSWCAGYSVGMQVDAERRARDNPRIRAGDRGTRKPKRMNLPKDVVY